MNYLDFIIAVPLLWGAWKGFQRGIIFEIAMLIGIILGLYLAFILLIAFAPGWLGTPLSDSTTVTRGIPVGVGLILSSFVLTGIYVFRANGEFDELNQKILKGVQS